MVHDVRGRATSCLAVILAGAAVCLLPTELAATEAPRASITVRVYRQGADLSSALEDRALREAETVLRAAFVDLRWQDCTRQDRSVACDVPAGPSELLLVVRDGSPCQEMPARLGHAIAGGVMATVHLNCIAWLARESRTDAAVLLGRVIAHELGHLMMRTSSHPGRGLMRAKWTLVEVRRNHATDWAFTPDDVRAMHQPLGTPLLK